MMPRGILKTTSSTSNSTVATRRKRRKKRRRVTFNSEEHVFCGVPTKKPVYFSSTISMMTSKCRSNKVSWRERV